MVAQVLHHLSAVHQLLMQVAVVVVDKIQLQAVLAAQAVVLMVAVEEIHTMLAEVVVQMVGLYLLGMG
jgi:hypothetical protein